MKDPPAGSCGLAVVDGQPGSQGPCCGVSVAPVTGSTNFDDDYNEWELGIGDLIIDLDADIEKSNDPMASATPASSPPVEHQATVDKGLKMKIKRKNLAKHEIVKAQDSSASPPAGAKHSSSSKGGSRSGSHKKKRLENGASPPRLQCALPPSASAPPIPPPNVVPPPPSPPAAEANGMVPSPPPGDAAIAPEETADSPKRGKQSTECLASASPNMPGESPESPSRTLAVSTGAPVERKDSGVLCSSVGTITEPDCLGPCEPGTSVTLEGIVWQETEGGVLVVNVTWRGKTYVGTLLDCTRHDWAPPRFCESPTSDLDAKGGLPKGGRPKRARGDPEGARTPVQGKLRNGKGRRFAVPCSPAKNESRRRAPKAPEPELSPDKKRARQRSTPERAAPYSPALIPCPEPSCGKKYRHINGLRYHQSHAHGSGDAKGDEELSDGAEEGSVPPSPTPVVATVAPPPEEAPPPLPLATPPAATTEVPPVSVTVSIPTSQVFSFVPATVPPRASSPPPPPQCPPIAPDSPPPPVVPPPSPPKPSIEVAVQAPAAQSSQAPAAESLRQHKRPHKKNKTRKPEGSTAEEVTEEKVEGGAMLERAPPNLEESVQSPAYSDISDDAAPLLEAAKDKEPQRASSELYGVYPYFGQPPYLLPGVPEGKAPSVEDESKKDAVGRDTKPPKDTVEGKKAEPDFPQFPPYPLCAAGPYVQPPSGGYPYEPYHVHHLVDNFNKDSKPPVKEGGKAPTPVTEKPRPPPRRPSPEPLPKEPPECKEESKAEPKFSPYEPLYERRFLYLPEAEASPKESPKAALSVAPPPPPLVVTPKEAKEKEGQKPTMETTGPPPPANYAYLHPGYLPSHFPPPHHVAFESVYRGLPHYGGSPYLRFHVPPPEGPPQAPGPPPVGPGVGPPPVGPPQGTPKALDLLHQVSQHYSNHKIHELQERAVPSPASHTIGGDRPPKGSASKKGIPRGGTPQEASPKGVPLAGCQQPPPGSAHAPIGAQNPAEGGGSSRSPPPQRHLHTHHHTHVGVGVGYPLYDPYGVPPSPWKQSAPQRPYRVMP